MYSIKNENRNVSLVYLCLCYSTRLIIVERWLSYVSTSCRLSHNYWSDGPHIMSDLPAWLAQFWNQQLHRNRHKKASNYFLAYLLFTARQNDTEYAVENTALKICLKLRFLCISLKISENNAVHSQLLKNRTLKKKNQNLYFKKKAYSQLIALHSDDIWQNKICGHIYDQLSNILLKKKKPFSDVYASFYGQ